jgi:hypothetical protein
MRWSTILDNIMGLRGDFLLLSNKLG